MKVLRVRGDHHQLAAVALHKGPVLHKVRSDRHEFRAVDCQSPDNGHQRRSRAAGKIQILGTNLRPIALVQIDGHRLSDAHISGGRRVAVDFHAVLLGHNVHNGLIHLFRGGHGGIADGKVIHVLLAHNGRLL